MAFDQMVAALCGGQPRRKHGEIHAGDTFTRLIAADKIMHNKWGGRMRWCVCSCGNEGWFREVMLRNGNTKSCGCLRRDHAREMLPLARAALALKMPQKGSDGRFLRKDNNS